MDSAAQTPSGRHGRSRWFGVVGVAIVVGYLSYLLWKGLGAGGTPLARVLVATTIGVAAALAALAFRWRAAAARGRVELEALRADLEFNLTLFRLIFDKAPTSFVVIDDKRRIVRANPTAERVHAMPITQDDCGLELKDPVRCTICPGCNTLRSGESGVAARDHTDPRTGEILRIETYPLELPDGRLFALMVERIVTAQRKLEASLLHQEKMAAFGMVAAGVAHEMGNPLSSIDMHLQLLDAAAGLPEAHRNPARLGRTLRELVDFARRRRDEPGPVAVRAVIDDTLRLVRYDPRFRRIETEIDVDPNTPAVRFAEDHLVHVILNLVINALDAMPEGGRLFFEVQAAAAQVVVRIRDTGTGMPRHVLERCLEPLFTTKARGRGTGLGLAICRDLVERAGGRIELHSVPGEGTTVLLTLPSAGEAAAKTAASAGGTKAADPRSGVAACA